MRELETLLELAVADNPYLVRFYRGWEEDGFLFLQSELLQLGTLQRFIELQEQSLPEEVLWQMLADLSMVFAYYCSVDD